MRKTALILIMLTLWGLSANVLIKDASAQESGEVIDVIVSATEIVVGDVTYRIDPDAAFYAADGKTLIDFSYFKEGDAIEMTLNSSGVIIELAKSTGR